ncbi:MAG: ABC transporter ATP-binding protein [Solirubrobacterales bacterium]
MTNAATTAPAIETRELTKIYAHGEETQVDALRGIDFKVERGEYVAVMGPSGSGKSTLLHIIGAMDMPTGGHVSIGGVSFDGIDDDGLTQIRRDKIGFVFQFFNLLGNLTAIENIMLPALISGAKASEIEPRARVLLEMVDLAERADHLPTQLSGGEQQRVSIARALIRDPEVLMTDEPTGKLDTNTAASILGIFDDLHAREGHTILMVTHDPVAASHARRVVFLRDGEIAGEVPGGDRDRIVEFITGLDGAPAA